MIAISSITIVDGKYITVEEPITSYSISIGNISSSEPITFLDCMRKDSLVHLGQMGKTGKVIRYIRER